MCCTWKKKDVEVMTLNGEMCINSVEQIDHRVNGGTAKLEALVAQEVPIRFNILIDIDTIENLGGVSFSKSGKVHFLHNLLHAQ